MHIQMCTHTDVRTHRYTYAQKSERYMHTQMHTHRYTYRCTHREIHTQIYTDVYTHIHVCTGIRDTHTDVHTERYMHTHRYRCVHTHMHRDQSYTHRCTHIDTHTDVHTERDTHTQMCTHRSMHRRAHTDESGLCRSLPRPHPLRLSHHCLSRVCPSSGSFLAVCVSPRRRCTGWGLLPVP